MKTYRLKILMIALLTIAFNAIGQVEKTEEVNKSYQVDENVTLEIVNKFGKVHINTWDKPEMVVKVIIKVEDRNEDKAESLLNKIDIDVNESSSIKRFETSLSKNLKTSNRQSFRIDYEVSMPSKNPLQLKNSFGNIYLGNHSGSTDISLSYGDLKAGSLTGDSELKLSFGNGDLDEFGSGEMTIKYGKLEIEKVGDVKIKQSFSDLVFDEVGVVDLESKYGSLELGTVESIEGTAGFSGFEIDRLNKKLVLESSYVSGFRIDELSKNFEIVDIEGKFGNYRITMEEGATPTVEGNFRFSNMSYSKSEINMSYVEKEMNKSTYKGKVGDGTGGKIKIVSSYGDLKIGF